MSLTVDAVADCSLPGLLAGGSGGHGFVDRGVLALHHALAGQLLLPCSSGTLV